MLKGIAVIARRRGHSLRVQASLPFDGHYNNNQLGQICSECINTGEEGFLQSPTPCNYADLRDEFRKPGAVKAAIAEFISTLIFVFAGEGSRMAFAKLTSDASTTPAGLLAVALAHALGLSVAVAVAANVSGGHCNPAVTFGALVGGHITVFRLVLYWVGQLVGSVAACGLLTYTAHGMTTSPFGLASGVGVWNAVVFEIVMTFALVYTVYATAIDPKKGSLGTIGPIAIGFILGANILSGGAFEGAALNPARAFGPALLSWTWAHHWIYWVGPLLGGGLAGIIYQLFFISPEPTRETLQISVCYRPIAI
eukprot:Gb_26586 [translate_table: standard]